MTRDNMFIDRLGELVASAEDGVPAAGSFADPAMQYEAAQYLAKRKPDCAVIFYGGFKGAERKIPFALPDYFGQEGDEPNEAAAGFISGVLDTVYIRGSGYEKLEHRSFLGALTALGIDRSKLGDIIVDGESGAYLICGSAIAGFLTSDQNPLVSVGRDKVTVERIVLPVGFSPERAFDELSATVASARLDCVVAALTGLSREKAVEAIESGLVTHNYSEASDRTRQVAAGDVLSIRGRGKYRIASADERTRKDRLRLRAEKLR